MRLWSRGTRGTNLPVYPNLARKFTPTAINQLWIADLTYIRLRTEFVYLAVLLDAFSRRVIGWALGRTLEAELAIAALRMALIERRPSPGLVHHSDRGVQYASGDYTARIFAGCPENYRTARRPCIPTPSFEFVRY